MKNNALIGHTGFVGGNLQRQFAFDDCFNSANIESIAGRQYDLIVCAGAPGVKWKANQEPDRDRASIDKLTAALSQVEAREFVLISTVDVYPVPVDVTEDAVPDEQAANPYGRHRRQLERFVQDRFDSTVIRLPGLFGDGLKKNVIYDLLNNNAIDNICPESVFQFYSLDRLWSDAGRIRESRLRLINVATEGLSVRELARAAFNVDLQNSKPLTPARYDFRSKHAESLGGSEGYLYRKAAVLDDLKVFVDRQVAGARR